ncbi:hypothetical protein Bca101_047924 [Brassica carinata]
MLNVSAVAIRVGKLREERTESTTESRSSSSAAENFVAALLALSHESLRFKKIAKEAIVPQSKPPPPPPQGLITLLSKEMDFRERLPTFHQSSEGRSKLLHPLTRTISFSKMECLLGMGKARSIIGVGGEIAKRIRVVNEPLESISSDLGFSGHTLAEGGTLCISSFEWM